VTCACKKAKISISARLHIKKTNQGKEHLGIRLFENSDIEIIEIQKNCFSLTTAYQRMAPIKNI
jgi:hypothetical protein